MRPTMNPPPPPQCEEALFSVMKPTHTNFKKQIHNSV